MSVRRRIEGGRAVAVNGTGLAIPSGQSQRRNATRGPERPAKVVSCTGRPVFVGVSWSGSSHQRSRHLLAVVRRTARLVRRRGRTSRCCLVLVDVLRLLMVVVAVLLVMPAGRPVVAVLPSSLVEVSVAQHCSVGLAASIRRGLVTVLVGGALLLLLLRAPRL